MSYYDEDFKPWQIAGGQCVVADEAEWSKLVELNDESECNSFVWEQDFSTIVKVPTDIFEYVEGQVFDQSLKPVFTNEHITTQRPLTVNDLLTRFFQTVDATPHVDYLLVTKRPELVRSKWILAYPPHSHDWPRTNGEKRFRRNVTIAVPVETQADIERLIPELLKCHDLCKGLEVICNPTEKLDFRKFVSGLQCDFCGPVVSRTEFDGQCNVTVCESCFTCFDDAGSTVTGTEAAINRVIAEGNEHPIHPDHVRSLRDQCLDAEVEFNFASWGSYVPSSCVPPCPDTGHYLWPWKDQGDETMMLAIDAERSCRLLDGQEHNGRVS